MANCEHDECKTRQGCKHKAITKRLPRAVTIEEQEADRVADRYERDITKHW